MHTTNYLNTFIEASEDCPVKEGEMPPEKAVKTVASLQFEMIAHHPYKFTSDDVLFQIHALRNELRGSQLKEEREKFFSKGQACFRSSPLTKRYGWGVHNNEKGKIAIYPVGSEEYKKLQKDKSLEHVKAMRSRRK